MIEINLRDILNEGQFYVVWLSDKLGINVKAVKHKIFTNTCFEKANLISWDSERVIKAVFFSRENNVYGFVFPELGKEIPTKIDKEIFQKTLDVSKKQAKDFRNSYCPEGMEYGTCTPFVLENAFEKIHEGKKLEKIFICDFPKINKQLVDISIGGFGEEAHKISVHLNYEDIYTILHSKFGNKINQFSF